MKNFLTLEIEHTPIARVCACSPKAYRAQPEANEARVLSSPLAFRRSLRRVFGHRTLEEASSTLTAFVERTSEHANERSEPTETVV